MEIDFSKYTNLEHLVEDIKSVKVQGATNVALATFEGLKLFIKNYDKKVPYEVLLADVEKAGISLAYARPNEPLAKNGLKYVTTMLKIKYPGEHDIQFAREKISELCDEYLKIIKDSKKSIIENSESILGNALGLLTHCHSSTSEAVIVNQAKRMGLGFKVACSETQPLMQGRITAKNLLDAGLDVTYMEDSSRESFIIGRDLFTVDAVLIGCDEITMQGDAINKIGSWGAALACYYASKPIYVVTSILKLDPSTIYKPVEIEMRKGSEVWPDAPKGLTLFNPAFELIDKQLITGFMTEFGLVRPSEVQKVISDHYGWLY
jgi:translation initiation factor 2B subunit (eIF-2B alpha/beta/delta family)